MNIILYFDFDSFLLLKSKVDKRNCSSISFSNKMRVIETLVYEAHRHPLTFSLTTASNLKKKNKNITNLFKKGVFFKMID